MINHQSSLSSNPDQFNSFHTNLEKNAAYSQNLEINSVNFDTTNTYEPEIQSSPKPDVIEIENIEELSKKNYKEAIPDENYINRKIHEITMLGIKVAFPYENIYQSQRAIIANSLKAFTTQSNALLQSPTGTGKGLALLSAALAFQQHVVDKQLQPVLFPQNDMRPNQEFAIFASGSSTSDLTRFQDEPPRIWFTSRTHTQIKQLVNEFKKLPYNPTMVVLAGRKHLCLNKKVLKAENQEELCRRLTEEKKCPYIMKAGIPKEFRKNGRLQKFDIEDMIEYGKKNARCPYHMSLVILSKADLIFCPYNYILDPKIKGMLELSLVGSLLIIDEAHNIENVCREAANFKFTAENIAFTIDSLNNMKNTFLPEDSDLIHFILLYDFVITISKWFNSLIAQMKENDQKQIIYENIEDVLGKWGVTPQKWPQYECILTTIITRKKTVVSEPQEKPHFELPFPALTVLEDIFIFFVLVFKNNMENAKKFRICVALGERLNGMDNNFQVICLSPGVIFRCAERETHSIILASGTLSPLSTYGSELETKFPIQISTNHIIKPDQISSFIITHALDGTPFNSSYQNLQTNKATNFYGLGKLFETLLPEIPGGVLLFMPSYSLLTDLKNIWKKNGYWDVINAIKPIFVEKSKKDKTVFQNYIKSIEKGDGGFMIGVCRGKMSEGTDFTDDQARAVFVYGISYPSLYDIDIQLKRSYNDRTEGLLSGSEWYESQAFRSIFQAVGRCIRHQNDYGSIILIDQRYLNFYSKFPNWLKDSFINHTGINDIKLKLNDFYHKMGIKFPKKVTFQRGQPVTFQCHRCKAPIIELPSIDIDEAEQTQRIGFLKFVESDQNASCIFLSRNKKKKIHIKPTNKLLWSQEDLSSYKLLTCSCGSKLGVYVAAATRQESHLMDGYIFLLNRLNISYDTSKETSHQDTPSPRQTTHKHNITSKQKRITF